MAECATLIRMELAVYFDAYVHNLLIALNFF